MAPADGDLDAHSQRWAFSGPRVSRQRVQVGRSPRRDYAAAMAPERVSGRGLHARHDVARFVIIRAARARTWGRSVRSFSATSILP